jgi:hypothetical protein
MARCIVLYGNAQKEVTFFKVTSFEIYFSIGINVSTNNLQHPRQKRSWPHHQVSS